jgi:drug/metabolite transporter (DMT)-like permease
MNETNSSRTGLIAAFFTICIWTGFILVSRYGGKGVLTGWDVTALRFGVGALIALIFLSRVILPPYKVILLFSVFGGIGYSVVVYTGFRLAPAAHAAVLLPGTLPFARRDCMVVAKTKTISNATHLTAAGFYRHHLDRCRYVLP